MPQPLDAVGRDELICTDDECDLVSPILHRNRVTRCDCTLRIRGTIPHVGLTHRDVEDQSQQVDCIDVCGTADRCCPTQMSSLRHHIMRP